MTLKQLNRFLTKIVAEGQTADLIFAKHSYFRLHGNVQRQILVYHLDGLVDIFKTDSMGKLFEGVHCIAPCTRWNSPCTADSPDSHCRRAYRGRPGPW